MVHFIHAYLNSNGNIPTWLAMEKIYFKLIFERKPSQLCEINRPIYEQWTYFFNEIKFFRQAQRPYYVSFHSRDRTTAFVPSLMRLTNYAFRDVLQQMDGVSLPVSENSLQNPIAVYVLMKVIGAKKAAEELL